MTDLREKAMLVDLSCSFWTGRKRDKNVTEETQRAKKAEKGTGSWWTYAVPREELKDIFSAINYARSELQAITLPWKDDGTRILPASLYLKMSQKMRKHHIIFTRAVDAFLERYPELIREAKDRLGDLFDPDAFPSPSIVRSKFGWRLDVLPMPDSRDFRVDIGTDEAKTIKDSVERNIRATMQKAVGDVWSRLFKVVNHMAERLGDPDAIIRDSLVGKVVEVCEILPDLNLTGDKDLEKMRRQCIRKLTKLVPNELRTNPDERQQAAEKAKEITNAMKEFMGIEE